MGQAKGASCGKTHQTGSGQDRWAAWDECGRPEAAIGTDEGTVGGEKEAEGVKF
jgi:hypothetical protein